MAQTAVCHRWGFFTTASLWSRLFGASFGSSWLVHDGPPLGLVVGIYVALTLYFASCFRVRHLTLGHEYGQFTVHFEPKCTKVLKKLSGQHVYNLVQVT